VPRACPFQVLVNTSSTVELWQINADMRAWFINRPQSAADFSHCVFRLISCRNV